MEIQIEQQCHGYKGGHQLLGSSVKLAREDQDIIDRLSDVSGSLRPDEKFSPYLTSYPVPSGDYYVIAKTWQDLEARRAGCVLTRSFLIRSSDWADLGDVQGLIEKFRVVDRQNLEAETFTITSTLCREIPPVEASQTIELVEALFLEERQPVVVFGATEADLIITRLLTALWPGIKLVFSTCSFALGPRTVSGRPFDLVFSPKELRSRFAKWEGRRIDGSGERGRVVRHRWSVATARLIFEDATPALSKLDALGVLARDHSGDESRLRLALLWNDLVDQSRESPTAVLGMLDILHSHVRTSVEHDHDIVLAVSQAVHLSKAMAPSKRLEFLVLLSIKLEGAPIPLRLAVDLRRSFAQAASADASSAVRLLGSVLPDVRFMTRLLFSGIGEGVASNAEKFLSERTFSMLSDEHLVLLLAVSRSFPIQLVGNKPACLDDVWIKRLSTAIVFPRNEFTPIATENIVSNLMDGHQAPLLKACLRDAQIATIIQAVNAIWKKSQLTINAFDSVLLDAVTGRPDLLELRRFLLALPEVESTTRLLSLSLDTSVEEFVWLLQEDRLGEARRVKMLYSLLEQSNDTVLGGLARTKDILERMLSVLTTPPPSPRPLHAYLKALAWSNISIDRVLSVELPMLQEVRGQLRSELLDNLTSKALRFASPSSNRSLCEMIADDAFVVNPDYLVANAVSSESSPARISDNLVILNRAPAAVRREMLRYIDNLSFKLIQNHAERLNDDGIFAWSQLIADSGKINPTGQLRAAGAVLTFALPQIHLNVSPLVVASFPLVYRELKQGNEGPSVWSIFFPDWDRCKTVRKEIVSSFLRSSWPPSDFLKASLATEDFERILNTLLKDEGGSGYLRLLREHTNDLEAEDRKRVSKTVDRVLLSEEHR
jgi:hypothetical protein